MVVPRFSDGFQRTYSSERSSPSTPKTSSMLTYESSAPERKRLDMMSPKPVYMWSAVNHCSCLVGGRSLKA